MKLHKLTETIKKWTTGSPLADQHLSNDVKRDLQRTVQDDTFVLYRGWKFADFEDMESQLGGQRSKSWLSISTQYFRPTQLDEINISS